MANWLGNLLKPFAGGEAKPALALGAFGKHPGWDDHIEDVGLETEALLTARQLLYVQGIGGVIDSAVWDKMAEGETLPAFGHLAFWFSEPDLLVARLWASQDRKGRARYPMVVCAHAANLEARTAMGRILPILQKAEESCRETKSAETVNSSLAGLRGQLREAIDSTGAVSGNGGRATPPPLPLSRATIAARLGLAADNDAWGRIVYAAETQLAAHLNGKVPEGLKRFTMKMTGSPALAQALRLPSDDSCLPAVILFWRDLLTQILHTSAPLLFLQPDDQMWLDAIVGTPGVKQLTCLKASTKAIPLTQDVPYTLSGDFRARAAKVFADFVAQG